MTSVVFRSELLKDARVSELPNSELDYRSKRLFRVGACFFLHDVSCLDRTEVGDLSFFERGILLRTVENRKQQQN